jgi:membrane peptidoglycan carboxypeptidase
MLRDALARSSNLATVNLLNGSIRKTPLASLDYVCAVALELKLYQECVRYYPFILGAQPIRPVDLAAFYATIANEGVRPTPHVIAKVTRGKATVFADETPTDASVSSTDRAAFYQLKTMLQGVLARGTASSISHLAPYVAGKTGTTSDENDIWFAGFTNEVTVVVWIGYDNATGTRRTLGTGATGGSIAVPIFEKVIEAVWAGGVKKTPLSPASTAALASLTCESSGRGHSDADRLPECYRKDPSRKIASNATESTKLHRRIRPVVRAKQAAEFGCDPRTCATNPFQQREWKMWPGFGERPQQAAQPRRAPVPQQPARSGFFFGSW